MTFPNVRLRRLRQTPLFRDLIRETSLHIENLILPLFIKGEKGKKKAIEAMPGHFQHTIESLQEEVEEILKVGLNKIILFGVPPYKDLTGSNSYSDEGIVQKAIKKIKEATSDLLIISDTCFCEYTSHGHCGILVENKQGSMEIDNDKTLELLILQAVSQAKAGSDLIAPSGCIDGMVQAIRKGLDSAGFANTPILSYSVKYHSSMYGPFRSAAEGAPASGDRSSHQMDPANSHEALREVLLDIEEGADMVMVKPAHTYLDIIYRIKKTYPHLPLGAYHTSGEFGMIKAATEKGWLNEIKGTLEVLTAIRRAGADFIITYFAKDAAQWLAKR